MENKWYQKTWLPFAAFAYIVICIFDFIIMPVYVTAHNSRIENAVFKTLEGKDTLVFADAMIKANQAARQWNPITLLGAGMFHLAFGALLTGGAVTRGFAKKSEIEGYWRNSPFIEPSTNPVMGQYRRPAFSYGPATTYPYTVNRPEYSNVNQSFQDNSSYEEGGPMKRTDNLS